MYHYRDISESATHCIMSSHFIKLGQREWYLGIPEPLIGGRQATAWSGVVDEHAPDTRPEGRYTCVIGVTYACCL